MKYSLIYKTKKGTRITQYNDIKKIIRKAKHLLYHHIPATIKKYNDVIGKVWNGKETGTWNYYIEDDKESKPEVFKPIKFDYHDCLYYSYNIDNCTSNEISFHCKSLGCKFSKV